MNSDKSKNFLLVVGFSILLFSSLFYLSRKYKSDKIFITFEGKFPDTIDNRETKENDYSKILNSKAQNNIVDILDSVDNVNNSQIEKKPNDYLESNNNNFDEKVPTESLKDHGNAFVEKIPSDSLKDHNNNFDEKIPNDSLEDHNNNFDEKVPIDSLEDHNDNFDEKVLSDSLKNDTNNTYVDKDPTDTLKDDTNNTFIDKDPTDTLKNNDTSVEEEPYFKECLNIINEKAENKKYKEAVVGLSNYLLLEPLAEINETCQPPPLEENVICENYKSAFGDNPRPANNKIGILIQFGFDIEILEIYLNEVYDLVDKFFIAESIATHSSDKFSKPLIWDKLKNTERFSKFSDKIVHFVIDDSDLINKNGIFASESNQEKLRWEKFLKWNEENNFFGDDDIIGFGDADEIPSRKAINILKSCTGDFVSIDIGSLFIYGTYNTVVRSDWPISGYPYTLGDPSFYTLKSAKEYSSTETPNRRRGRSGKYLVGEMGIHLTYFPYLPFLVNKYLVCSECSPLYIDPKKSMDEIEYEIVNYSKSYHKWRNYDDVIDQVKDIYFIPWFLKCNPDRFPTFYHKPDPRVYLPKSKINFEC